ncbi:hypothetical protein CLOM_g16865, partial [Closterium sp. NIES-68]
LALYSSTTEGADGTERGTTRSLEDNATVRNWDKVAAVTRGTAKRTTVEYRTVHGSPRIPQMVSSAAARLRARG